MKQPGLSRVASHGVASWDAAEASGPSQSPSPNPCLRGREGVVDGLVAAGVFVYNAAILPTYAASAGATAGLFAVAVVLCGAFLVRRRWPLAVLAVMLVAACAQLLLGAPLLPVDTLLLAGVYTVATLRRWPVSLGAAVVVVAWLLVAVIPHLGRAFLDIGQLGVLVVVAGWVWTWGTLVRIRRQYVAGLRERAEQAERERETNARMAVADERARIAREIHDSVSHSLSVVVVMSDGAAATVDADPERAKAAMRSVRDTGRSAMADMRRMLGVLRDDEPGSQHPQPRLAQLGALVDESRAAGMPVGLTVSGDAAPASAGVELTAYRVVQEALTNVRKHAGRGVRRVEVRVSYRPEQLEVRVTDDGPGVTTAAGEGDSPVGEVGAVGGHGLVGMRERVGAHGGSLRTGPRDGGGYEVVAVLPLDQAPLDQARLDQARLDQAPLSAAPRQGSNPLRTEGEA